MKIILTDLQDHQLLQRLQYHPPLLLLLLAEAQQPSILLPSSLQLPASLPGDGPMSHF